MSIRSGDIRDQIWKMSKTRWILDVFTLPNFVGGTSAKISVNVITAVLCQNEDS